MEDSLGRSAERYVPSPADLVSTGEALLASPAPRPDPTQGAPAAAPTDGATIPARATPQASGPAAATTPDTPDAGPAEPRVLLSALLDTRYAGPTKALCSGVGAEVGIPFSDWSFGSWGRFDWPIQTFDDVPLDYSSWEASIGLFGAWRFLRTPVELHATLTASLAVVSMGGGVEGAEAEGGRADPRLGVELRLVWPVDPVWRPIAALGAEMAPAALAGSAKRRIDPMLPLIPSYTVGLSLGLEVAIP